MISHAQHMLPWHQLRIVVLDFETTGVDPTQCAPVEVAGDVVERASELINPGCPIPAEATFIHGITDEMVITAYPAAVAINNVLDRVLLDGDAIPCAYNARFDSTIFRRIMGEREGASELVALRDWPWLDPLVVVRHVDRFVRGSGRHSLSAVCARRGIALEGAHRATADAEAAGRVLFSEDVRAALGDATISEVLRRQTIRADEQEADFEAWRAKQPKREGATP